MSSDPKIRFVIHKYDFTGVGVFAATSFLAYSATSRIVDKFAQLYFPYMEESYYNIAKAACVGVAFHAFSHHPYITMISLLTANLVIDFIHNRYGSSKYAPCPPFLENLNEKFRGKSQAVFGNQERIKQLEMGLIGTDKKNALMVGLPGIGKTQLVEGMAWLIANGKLEDERSVLQGKIIYVLHLNQMTEGTGIVGVLDTRFQQLVAFVQSRSDLIIFIDELHEILGAGKHRDDSINSVAQKLKHHIINGNWRIIGALTHQDYEKHIRSEPTIFRRYNLVKMSEPNRDECLEILTNYTLTDIFKKAFPDVVFTEDDILYAVDLTNKLLPKAVGQPDLAKDVIDQAARIVLNKPEAMSKAVIQKAFVSLHTDALRQYPNALWVKQLFGAKM